MFALECSGDIVHLARNNDPKIISSVVGSELSAGVGLRHVIYVGE